MTQPTSTGQRAAQLQVKASIPMHETFLLLGNFIQEFIPLLL